MGNTNLSMLGRCDLLNAGEKDFKKWMGKRKKRNGKTQRT